VPNQVEETLKPQVAKMGEDVVWEAMVKSLQPKLTFPATAKLTAYALYDGKYCDDAGVYMGSKYHQRSLNSCL
jgi:hypothetical protein